MVSNACYTVHENIQVRVAFGAGFDKNERYLQLGFRILNAPSHAVHILPGIFDAVQI